MSLSFLSAASPHLFRPSRKGSCLCGSGLTFKRCCADRLRDEVDYDSRMRAFLKEGKFKDALYACRAYVTHYTIWHKSHTEPAVRAGMAKRGSILETDIRALAALIDHLMFCHVKAEMMDEFPSVLERLESISTIRIGSGRSPIFMSCMRSGQIGTGGLAAEK
jgi:hypothetical protein